MSEDEIRTRLDQMQHQSALMQEQANHTQRVVDELHKALLVAPVGSGRHGKSFMERHEIIARDYERGKWTVRLFVYVVPLIAALWFNGDSIKQAARVFLKIGPQE